MVGYILELYKNICTSKGYNFENTLRSELGQAVSRENAYMTFGYFDKMAVSRVLTFSRMRDMSELSKTWIGDRQTILLYDINEDNELVYRNDEEHHGFYVNAGGEMLRSADLFIAVSVLQFAKCPDEEEKEMDECLRDCRKNILKLVKENAGGSVCCSVLGTLGTYGVAILWAADQYTDILRLINEIKGRDVINSTGIMGNDFLSFFTIFAKNDLEDNQVEGKLGNVNGKALLQITLQSEINQDILNEFRRNIKDAEFLHSAGEYDLLLKADVKELYGCFGREHFLHPEHPFYMKHILQTNLRLCDEVDLVFQKEEKKESKKDGKPKEDRGLNYDESSGDKLNTLMSNAREEYRKIRDLFFEKFPKTAGMVDSMDLLYGDFVSKVSSVSNKMWAYDFGCQFIAILRVIQKYLDKIRENKIHVFMGEALEDFRDILSCYEHQIVHIAESNNFVIDTPKCHLRYTGQNNLTLHAYFGITKDIIEFCYRLQGKSRQSQIMPLISADIVPIIESAMYIDYDEPDDDRVLKLNFPVSAFYNIPEYLPYLYHEIFHYVAPEDRVVRNWVKGVLLYTIGIRNVLFYVMKEYMGRPIADYISTIAFLPFIYRSVHKRYYDGVAETVKNNEKIQSKVQEIDSKALDWKRYERQLFGRMVDEMAVKKLEMVQENIIFKVLEDIYIQREEIVNVIYESDSIDTKSVVAGVNKFMEELDGVYNNYNNNLKAEAFRSLIEKGNYPAEAVLGMDTLESISDALSEVACDIPMVELGGMGIVHYLLSYVKIQRDLLGKPTECLHIQDYLRIGIVFDFLNGFEKLNQAAVSILKSYEADFTKAYIGLYYSAKKITEEKNPEMYLEEIQEEARQWFSWIEAGYQKYRKSYRIYGLIYNQLIKQISVNERKKYREQEEKGEQACNAVYNKLKKLQVQEYYEALRLYGGSILRTIGQNPSVGKKEFEDSISVDKQVFYQKLFKLNIKWIHSCQKQKHFDEIGEICSACFKKDKIYEKQNDLFENAFYKMPQQIDWEEVNKKRKPADYTYTIKGVDELFYVIEKISQNFSRLSIEKYGHDKHEIWYRGQSKSSYKLLPSAMRKYPSLRSSVGTLLEYQEFAYGEFKFRMDNSSEKVDRAGYTICDYLALMQHYGAPTIYMDWSENALWSLYFALEEYIDPKKKEKQHEEDAVLYILQPNLYNEARNQMMAIKKYPKTKVNESFLKTKQKSTNSLPNLSLENNAEKYYMFLLGANEEAQNNSKDLEDEFSELGECGKEELFLYLPLAIYASRANARVRAQNGMFMAFNAITPLNKKGKFDYMALETIQKLYLDKFESVSPFMYKIIISGESKKSIAEWLKAIGVCKDMIYPELSNIGERI